MMLLTGRPLVLPQGADPELELLFKPRDGEG